MWYGRKIDIERIQAVMDKLVAEKKAIKIVDTSRGVLGIGGDPTQFKRKYEVFLSDDIYLFAKRFYVVLYYNHRDNRYSVKLNREGLAALAGNVAEITDIITGGSGNGETPTT